MEGLLLMRLKVSLISIKIKLNTGVKEIKNKA
jgi:hypothetical protein